MASSPAQWPPLLAEALGEIESADSLVTWGVDAWGERRVVGLRELRVAALLFACSQQQEESSASPDWAGLLDFAFEDWPDHASLLELAVRFGHADIARCLHQRGQRQKRALGPYDFQRVPTESLATLPLSPSSGRHVWFGEWRRNEENGAWEQEWWVWQGGRWHRVSLLAEPRCPWGHWAQGDWASDWNASLPCARMLVDAPATRAALALAAEGVPLDLEEGAAVRLLDAALLLGEPVAAAALADRCGSRRPVRFWPGDRAGMSRTPMGLKSLEGHLRAGHPDLRALGFTSPAAAAAEAVEAGSRSLAQALSGLLEEDDPPAPLQLYGFQLLPQDGADTAVVKPAALDALEALGSPPPACGVALDCGHDATNLVKVSFLLFSCALGDERAARRLVRMGSTFTGLDTADTRPTGLLLDDDFGLAPAPRRLEVAEGSLRQLFLAAARRSCCAIAATKTKGCDLLGRPELLGQVVGFAMSWSCAEEWMRQEVQRLIGHDPLGDLAVSLCALCTRWSQTGPSPATVATAMQAASRSPPGQLASEQLSEAPGGGSAESSLDGAAAAAREPPASPRGAPSGEQQESSSAVPVQPAGEKDEAMENEELGQALQESALEAVQGEQEDVHRMLLMSKMDREDVELAFNDHVYALLRLTKNQREISEHLLAWEGLGPCRQRVEEAGCDLQPDWAGGALLLVPMTPELYLELCLELKGHHVLMLQSDVHLLEVAVRAMPSRGRPQVKRDHRANRYEGQEALGSEGSPSEVPAEEDAEQEGGEASGSAGEVDVAGLGVAKDEDWLCRYGIVRERIHIPANNFNLPVAMATAVTKSDPAITSHQGEGAQERRQQPGSGPGLHDFNPRLFRGSKPSEG